MNAKFPALLLSLSLLAFLACPALADAASSGDSSLIGTLYDLKRTSDNAPTGIGAPEYDRTIGDFLLKGWDEHTLSKYFRLAQTFRATHLFIPMIGDKRAPKEFGLEGRLADGFWVIHYKGQVVPPSDGRYRFTGYAHATLFVAINGKLVLNGSRFDVNEFIKDFPLKSGVPRGAPAGDYFLTIGQWVDLKASEPVDIDILVGNRVAAELCAFLLVEKAGETYQNDPATNYPILPLFQVAPYQGQLPQGNLGTNCLLNAMIWKCLP